MTQQELEIQARDQEAAEFEAWYTREKGTLYDSVQKQTIFAALELSGNELVLDAGCGTGRITRELARRCRKVLAVDFSPASIEQLRRSLRQSGIANVESAVADLTQPVPFAEQVDRVVSIEVLQHIPAAEGRLQAFRNLHHKLKPGGKFVAAIYNWSALPILRRGLSKEGSFDNGIRYFRFTSEEAREILEQAGFVDVKVTGCVNLRYGFINRHGLSESLPLLGAIDVALARFGVSTRMGQYLLCQGRRASAPA